MTPTPDVIVRRVRAGEWGLVRELRLASLQDPDAAIAFLDTYANSASRPDEFWMGRAAAAAAGDVVAQFVAIDGVEWVGTVSVISRPTGTADHLGRIVPVRRADVVGVYVRPAHRGDGTIDRLLDAAAAWARGVGFDTLSLDVHADNLRAQGAYRRAGFAPTGEAVDGPTGPELMMTRPLG